MSHLMTIQALSMKTGVSKSALRYYESKNLLCSIQRNNSGYRVYEVSQIEVVKLIASLRLIDVSIKDIKMYLKEQDSVRKQEMVVLWKENIKRKRNLLDISYRFLESNSLSESIYLKEKHEEKIIWFNVEGRVGEFKNHFKIKAEQLQKMNISIENYYLKYLSGEDVLKVQIGFGVMELVDIQRIVKPSSIEVLPSSIVLAMPFQGPIKSIRNGYFKLLNYAIENGWMPISSIMEWYHGSSLSDLEIILPVIQLEDGGI
ncbi:MAG: MerR family transcriptional regulator [Bacillaceae bacterium]